MTQPRSSGVVAEVRRAERDGTAAAVASAIRSIPAGEVAEFFHARLSTDAEPIATGTAASPGAASGRIVLTADAALRAADSGDAVVLVRPETTPDDVLGMQAARGILTARGGAASHAAVVARGWGIPAVVGASAVRFLEDGITVGGSRFAEGDEITIDGTAGAVYRGALATSSVEPPVELDVLLSWADAVNDGHVQVRANADNGTDATQARSLGAHGIGLCRTEHMFLDDDRLTVMRRFILTEDDAVAEQALEELERAQVADFTAILEAMDGLPVTVRLLDAPLHEFLPDRTQLAVRDALGELDTEGRAELAAVRRLHESNPMLGTRGIRLGMLRRGLYEMHVRALCEAAIELIDQGCHPVVEIMIPLVSDAEELRLARNRVTGILDELGHPELAADVVTVGAMIETPRAALTAGALCEHADFFSFGTNDLTQLTYGFSRDDVEAVLVPHYVDIGILPASPFGRLDPDGVGELVRLACERARDAKPSIKLGACGEHAGDPESIDLLVRFGVDAVSCSPFRVPVARLAVARALLASGRVDIDDVELTIHGPLDADTGPAQPSPPAATADDSIDIDEALVLHVLRIRGFVTPDGFVESIGAHPDDVLDALVDAGLVRHIEARGMYGLLPPGKQRHDEHLASTADPVMRSGLQQHYERFLAVNDRFKQLCATWQMRGGEPNDHSDDAYDRGCTDALALLAAETAPIIAGMADALPRLGRYASRLRAAADRVVAGEAKRFTGVMCESFHDIWMELHEDLIVLLGIDRTTEGSF